MTRNRVQPSKRSPNDWLVELSAARAEIASTAREDHGEPHHE